jgi:hypothetical protein
MVLCCNRSFAGCVLLVAAALPAAAWAGRAHEHGVARLDVGVEAARVVLELEMPLDSLVGFERAPRTDAERAKAEAALKTLRDGAALFRIDSQAGCELAKVDLRSPHLGAGGGTPGPGEHADLQGTYEFRCQAGAKAGFVEVGLFDAFGALKRIELQLATPRGQVKATLRKPASRVRLAR